MHRIAASSSSTTRSPSSREGGASLRLLLPLLGLAAAVVCLVFGGLGRSNHDVDPAHLANVEGELPEELYACASCHMLPAPDTLPKDRWPRVLDYMNSLLGTYEMGRAPLSAEEMAVVQAYYLQHSPAQLEVLTEDYAPSPLRFASKAFGEPASGKPGEEPFLLDVHITDVDRNGQADVLLCDGRRGQMIWARPQDGGFTETPVLGIKGPCATEVADLNGDGYADIAVAALGGIQPSDDPSGQLVLLLSDNNGRWSMSKVLENVSRVSDVASADFDGDGDLDLVVAMFGLYATGGVCWLERRTDGTYARHDIYHRTGCSHVAPADLDGDGDSDFVALLSQQHEEVVVFRNDGHGRFTPQTVFKASSPMFGCSGMRLVDLDGDGDPDVVFCNGDALDIDAIPKPWHGVHWLENAGGGQFTHHEIWRFHGAYAAAAADFDGDGDLDLVVTSMMNRWDEPGRQSLVWLENDGLQQFTPHALADAPTSLVSVDVGDLNGDGRPDVLAGGMYVMPPFRRIGRVQQWINLGPR